MDYYPPIITVVKVMVEGFMRGNIPLVTVTISNLDNVLDVTFTLDTGFSEDLLITPEIVRELELEIIDTDTVNIFNANGEKVLLNTSFVRAVLEDEAQDVQVIISKGFPLLGIGFLTKFGYKAIINCKERTVTLEK